MNASMYVNSGRLPTSTGPLSAAGGLLGPIGTLDAEEYTPYMQPSWAPRHLPVPGGQPLALLVSLRMKGQLHAK